MLIRYVRDHKRKHPVGCVIIINDDQIGWSHCCKEDQFTKERAKEIALGRALHGVSDKVQVPYDIRKMIERLTAPKEVSA